MTEWSGEALRRAALAALGEHADERARDALAHASVTVLHAGGWDGSAGPVEAHGVTLGLDARTLGGLRSAPAVIDALCAAAATAIATRPGEALLHLHLRWVPGARPSSAGYRDAPPAHGESLHGALVDYLDGGGQHALGRLLDGASLDEPGPGQLTIRLATAAEEASRTHPRLVAAVTSAAQDLLGDASIRVRVR
ncbi:MAG TPA: hypothetical protein VHS09_09105 [Polyangiaceae bacterium]|nr:hypothetical protein [Polyangiaceae bacterium]